MQGWFGFYSVIGAFAATLLGLLFVAVSINAAAILGDIHERRLAEQAFQNYLAVMTVSLLAIFPTLEIPTLGFVTLAVTAVWAAWVLIRSYLALRRPHEQDVHLRSAAPPVLLARRLRPAGSSQRLGWRLIAETAATCSPWQHDPAVLGDRGILGTAPEDREDKASQLEGCLARAFPLVALPFRSIAFC